MNESRVLDVSIISSVSHTPLSPRCVCLFYDTDFTFVPTYKSSYETAINSRLTLIHILLTFGGVTW